MRRPPPGYRRGARPLYPGVFKMLIYGFVLWGLALLGIHLPFQPPRLLLVALEVGVIWFLWRGVRAARRAPANQLRLWFSSFAYVLLEALRRIGLPHTELAQATCGTIRLKLLKLGARVTVSVRRIKIAIASACPHHVEFALAHARLRAPPG